MSELAREELIQAIRDAHEACYGEYMNCPWCEGRVGYENEWHNPECIWLKIEKLPIDNVLQK